jgi:hypothetical protein
VESVTSMEVWMRGKMVLGGGGGGARANFNWKKYRSPGEEFGMLTMN